MDRFKTVKEALKKYHFWVLCVVAIVVAMAAWGYATSDIDKKFRTRKRALDGAFAKVERISNKSGHPNLELIKAIKRQTEDLKKEVFDAWQILYRDQRENNKLPQNLSEKFKKAFWELEPGDDAELDRRYRQEYLNFIGEHYDELEASIDRLKPAEEQTRRAGEAGTDARQAGFRPGAAGAGAKGVAGGAPSGEKADQDGQEEEEEEETGKVIWDNPEFRNISTNWGSTPTTLQVRFAQEDFWVYEALIRIINKVNETATSHSNAGVKQIYAMQIGNAAAGAWKDSSANVVLQSAARTGRPTVRQEPTDSRYVDDEGEALAAGEDSPYAEFNMMPICMKLMMDQRKTSKLLVECANSSMPIEVRRVRLCPGEGSPAVALSNLTAQKGKPPARSGASFGHPAMGGYQVRQPSRRSSSVARTSPVDISIEILGIIYIYNPPDKAKLGTGTAGKKAEEEPAPPTQAGPEKPQPETVPSEKPAEGPVEKPVDKPVDKPSEGPVKPPAAKPSAGAANTPANTLGPGEATQGRGPAEGR